MGEFNQDDARLILALEEETVEELVDVDNECYTYVFCYLIVIVIQRAVASRTFPTAPLDGPGVIPT